MASRTGPEWPPLSSDRDAIIAWCIGYNRPTEFFTERLGLPLKETLPLEKSLVSKKGSPSKNTIVAEGKKKGKPMFEGEVASHCNLLHKKIMEEVQCIADKYHSKEELETAVKLQRDLSIAKTTKALLVHVGPIIWNESEPYQTKMLTSHYPRHLKFGNKNDLETIMLYVYCWIISRVTRAQSNRRASSRRLPPSRRATRCLPEDEDGDEDEDGVDPSGNSDEHVADVLDNNQSDANRHRSRINNPLVPLVPIASMLPMLPIKATSETLPGVTPLGAEKLSQPVASRDGSDAVDDGDESGTFQPDRPAKARGIKRRGYSSIDTPLNKRVAKSCHASETPRLTTKRKARKLSTEEEADIASYPSPPLLQLELPEEAPVGRNFPNIPLGTSSDWNKATVASSTSHTNIGTMAPTQHNEPISLSPAKESGSITTIARKGAASDNEDHDNDSVQGSEVSLAETIHECCNTTPSAPQQQMIVRLKLTILLDDIEHDRQRLATELFDVLFGKLRKLDIVVVESTLDLLESIYKVHRLRPVNFSVANLDGYRDSFDQWLRCLRLVIKYYKDTKFTGTLSERRAFKKTMPGGLAKSMTQILLRGRSELSTWRHKNGMNNNDLAKQVASVLFQVASWGDDVDSREVEEITLDFTEELLAWFN